VHIAVDTLGCLLALHVTPANAQDREQVAILAEAVQEATGQTVEVAYVDHGYTGPTVHDAAAQHGIDLVVVKLAQAKCGFVLLPRRWVVERSFAWVTRFRALPKTTNACQTWSKGCMSSPSSVSCSNDCCSSQRKVHNSL
jgi:transposase